MTFRHPGEGHTVRTGLSVEASVSQTGSENLYEEADTGDETSASRGR